MLAKLVKFICSVCIKEVAFSDLFIVTKKIIPYIGKQAIKSVLLCHNSMTVCNMADLNIIISEIELKLRKLIGEKNALALENKRLVEENAALEKENLTLRQSTVELQDKINKSTIVNALDNEGEVEEGRKLIKELVREIDRCVSILNSKE